MESNKSSSILATSLKMNENDSSNYKVETSKLNGKSETLNSNTNSNYQMSAVLNNGNSSFSSDAASNDTQRRNKKRKPPNYYQSAEYAAIIKQSDEISASAAVAANALSSFNNETQNDISRNTQSTIDSASSSTLEKANQITNHTGKDLIDASESIKSIEDNQTSSSSVQSEAAAQMNHITANDVTEVVTSNLTSLKIEENNEKQSIINEQKQSNEENMPKTNTDETKTQNEVTQSAQMNASASSSSSASGSGNKSWSSLFKNKSLSSTLASSTTSANPSEASSAISNSKNGQLQNSSSPSSSNANLMNNNANASSTAQVTSHAHLNGTTGHSSALSSSSSSSTNLTQASENTTNSDDLLKLLGAYFKQCELKHSAPALQPRGIRNKQNWCYVNATLQALLACPPFYNLIRNVYSKIKSSNMSTKQIPCITALGKFVADFKTMIRTSSTSSESGSNTGGILIKSSNSKELIIGEPFEIEYFYEALAGMKADLKFNVGRQEDAQEFLTFLLNRLHEEMIKCLESLNANTKLPSSFTSSSALSSIQTPVDHSKLNGNSGATVKSLNEENTNNQLDADDWKEVGKKNRAFVTRKVSANLPINLKFVIFTYVYNLFLDRVQAITII
jgi:hypothetical protein